MYECISPKKDSYQLNLLLKYNKAFQSAFVMNYHGQHEWVTFKIEKDSNESPDNINNLKTKILQEGEIKIPKKSLKKFKINILKGKVDFKQISNIEYKSGFYKNLIFTHPSQINDITSNSNEENLINEKYNIPLPIKVETEKNKYELKNLECQVCTYKLNNFEFRKCNNCEKTIHVECLLPYEKNYDSNELWYCRTCKPCKNCHSTHKNESKNFCSVCFDCYHSECLFELVQKNQTQENNNTNFWRCENCAKCLNCDKMLFKNLISSIK